MAVRRLVTLYNEHPCSCRAHTRLVRRTGRKSFFKTFFSLFVIFPPIFFHFAPDDDDDDAFEKRGVGADADGVRVDVADGVRPGARLRRVPGFRLAARLRHEQSKTNQWHKAHFVFFTTRNQRRIVTRS